MGPLLQIHFHSVNFVCDNTNTPMSMKCIVNDLRKCSETKMEFDSREREREKENLHKPCKRRRRIRRFWSSERRHFDGRRRYQIWKLAKFSDPWTPFFPMVFPKYMEILDLCYSVCMSLSHSLARTRRKRIREMERRRRRRWLKSEGPQRFYNALTLRYSYLGHKFWDKFKLSP